MDEKLIPRAKDPSFMSEHMNTFSFTYLFVLAWITISVRQCLGSSVWKGVFEPGY